MAKTLAEIKSKLLEKPGVREEYERQTPEFAAARAIIAARVKAKLTQEQLAERMGVKQPQVAKMESGRRSVGVGTLQKVADATKQRIRLDLQPAA